MSLNHSGSSQTHSCQQHLPEGLPIPQHAWQVGTTLWWASVLPAMCMYTPNCHRLVQRFGAAVFCLQSMSNVYCKFRVYRELNLDVVLLPRYPIHLVVQPEKFKHTWVLPVHVIVICSFRIPGCKPYAQYKGAIKSNRISSFIQVILYFAAAAFPKQSHNSKISQVWQNINQHTMVLNWSWS